MLELIEGEVAAAAKSHAESLHEWLSSHISESIDERIAEWFAEQSMDEIEGDQEAKIATDLIQPAFAAAVCRELSDHLRQTAVGWESVLWTNMKARYDETGEV